MSQLSPRTRLAFAARRFLHHLMGLELDPAALQQRILAELEPLGEGRVLPVAEEPDIAPADFLARYYRTGTPVVLRGLARDWPAVKRWTPRWLAERYGDRPLSVMDNDNSGGRFNVETMRVADFIAGVESGDTRKYLRFGNLLHMFPELVDDFDLDTLGRYQSRLRLGGNMGVFIGAAGTRTTLHAAPPDNLFAQVYGTKRWTLIDACWDPVLTPVMARSTYYWSDLDPDQPDLPRWPAARYMDRIVFELRPGDVLYNPPSWWHKVENRGPSIGVGFRWMSPMAPRLNLSQFLLFFAATNPPLWTVLRNKKHYAKVLEADEEKTARMLAG